MYEPPASVVSTSVQQGMRPWVVISNDVANLNSPTCNIAPCTTQDKPLIPTHVHTWFRNSKNTIMIEQNIPVDQFALKNSDYVVTLTDDTLEKIEKAIAIHYDIRPSISCFDVQLNGVVDTLNKMIEKILENKTKAYSASISKRVLEESAVSISDMINASLDTQLISSTNIESSAPASPPLKTREAEAVIPREPNSKGTRIKWTNELRRQYLDDTENMTPEQVRVKYGFGTIATVFQTKYVCKNYLSEET